MQPNLYTTVESPIGELLLLGDGEALCGLYMQGGRTRAEIAGEWRRSDRPFEQVKRQLAEYFDGARRAFDVPLRLQGTPFQRQAWEALREIPYGQTASYRELAERIGRPSATRAVGTANGRNPIAVIVPCHRVIGSDGSLIGFGGGLERKRTLLDLEGPAKTYKLIGADGKTYLSTTPGTIGGHRRNKGYGRLDCPAALRWIAKGHYVKHRVFFADERTAIAAGYRPCATCLPERYRAWKANKREFMRT